MALIATSCLHYWSARYGSVPVIGGRPVHSRSSAAKWIDQQGVVQSAIVNTPRFEWADLGDGAGRRAVMRLEQARTNVIQPSEDFSSGTWIKQSAVVTADAALAPDGTLTADKLAENNINDGHLVYQSGAFVANSAKFCWSIFVKAEERTTVGLSVLCSDGATQPYQNFDLSAGTSTGGAARSGMSSVGNGWWRVWIADTNAAGGSNPVFRIWINTVAAYVGTTGSGIYLWGAQIEVGSYPSSYVKTTTTSLSRATDDFSWAGSFHSYDLMVYIRFIERGSLALSSAGIRLLQLSKLNNTGPRLIILSTTGPNAYQSLHDNGTTSVTSTLGSTPVYSDTVELLARFPASGLTELVQSINGAAVTSGGASGTQAMNSTASVEAVSLNGIGGSYGLVDVAEVKIVNYPDVVASTNQGRMDEMRAFELGANGQVL